METISDILIFTLPFIIVLAVIVLIVYYLLKLEKTRTDSGIRTKNASAILNIRLQAYERLLLFLERISPQQLVVRNNDPQLSVAEFQGILISNIREEYEHNLVQQLYISDEAWAGVEQARAWVMKLVNDAASGLDDNENAKNLAMLIVEREMKAEKNYIETAISTLKQEVRQLF